jgi:hypothetical protein
MVGDLKVAAMNPCPFGFHNRFEVRHESNLQRGLGGKK